MRIIIYVLDTALPEWVSQYAVRTYTTADSAVSYLNHQLSVIKIYLNHTQLALVMFSQY